MIAVDNLAETILAQLETQELVRVPASEAEYLDIAPGFPRKLEYYNGEIIATCLASFWHEVLVNSTGFLLEQFYRNQRVFVSNSNAGLQVFDPELGYVQPDLMVIQNAPVFTKTAIITNPYLVVEVLSRSTSQYNKEHKLPLYKDIETLYYIVYVAQNRPCLTVYERTQTPDVWLNTDYRRLDSIARLGELTLPLNKTYHKIDFAQTAE
jgi:Uma2 family endonuclease